MLGRELQGLVVLAGARSSWHSQPYAPSQRATSQTCDSVIYAYFPAARAPWLKTYIPTGYSRPVDRPSRSTEHPPTDGLTPTENIPEPRPTLT